MTRRTPPCPPQSVDCLVEDSRRLRAQAAEARATLRRSVERMREQVERRRAEQKPADPNDGRGAHPDVEGLAPQGPSSRLPHPPVHAPNPSGKSR